MYRILFICISVLLLLPGCQKGQIETPEVPVETLYTEAMQLIDSYRGEGEVFRQAADLVNQILAQDSESPLADVLIGRLYRWNGYQSGRNYDTDRLVLSQQAFGRALKADSTLFDAYVYGAYPYLRQKTSQSITMARQLLEGAERINPKHPRVVLIRQELALLDKNWQLALGLGDQIIASCDDINILWVVYNNQVKAYKKLKRYDKAEDCLQTIIVNEPENAWAHHNYAVLLVQRARYDEAIAESTKALELRDFGMAHRVLADGYNGKAQRLFKEGRYDEALATFQLALEQTPDEPNLHQALGYMYYVRWRMNKRPEDLEQAEQFYLSTLRLDPEHQYAKRQLAGLRKEKERLARGEGL